jgi:uncharacterized tellurite resistance protein B-like protein
MFRSLQETIENLLGLALPAGAPAFDKDDRRLLAAALLTEVALVDGTLHPQEKDRIRQFITGGFQMPADLAEALLNAAEERARTTEDPLDIAEELRRAFDASERRVLADMLWEVARADGVMHEFEEGLIERVERVLDVKR